MSTRWYENYVEFRCKSCENELKGVVYKDDFNPSTRVNVEPCQRCLQCAELEIKELQNRFDIVYQTIGRKDKEITELRLRIANMYVNYEGRRAKTQADWEKWNEQS